MNGQVEKDMAEGNDDSHISGSGGGGEDNGNGTESFEVQSVIDTFLHRVRDIEECAEIYISAAAKSYNSNADKLRLQIDSHQALLREESDETVRIIAFKELRKAFKAIERHNSSSPVTTLEKSLFINLFSVFDKFIGDLVAVLYSKKPELYKNISKEISLSEALKHETMAELRQVFLDKEIESIRRKSYGEQFKDLENKFSIKLTQFDDWKNFIERAQRRNLFTHCDGIVSKQYLDSCREAGYKHKEPVKIGDQLDIGANYLFGSCMLVAQVGIMLGHTLWRKTLESELQVADSHLSNIVFDYLQTEHWGNAISTSNFAHGLPKISTEAMERMYSVNHAIALKAINKSKAAKAILDRRDWSAVIYDFKLAYAILVEDYTEAEALMCKIGKSGEYINELSYHEWPLFRQFRDTPEFFRGFETVYGYEYSSKLQELAEIKKTEVENSEEPTLDD